MEAQAAQYASPTTQQADPGVAPPPAPPPPPDDENHQALVAAAAAEQEGDVDRDDRDGDDEEVQVLERRKFFPRIKVLLSDEYADFLKNVIEALEASNCASFSMATADTPWNTAFDVIYGTVAREFSMPVGKNRLHKFKTKMIELWIAMEREAKLGHRSSADPVYKMALKQWEIHQSVNKDRANRSHEKTVIVRIGGEDDDDDDDGSDLGGEGASQEQQQAVTSGGAVTRGRSRMSRSNNNVFIPDDLAESLRHSITRLEHMISSSGLVPPRLPSPLHELVRIKDQMDPSEFRRLVQPTYEREVIRHLEVVMTQAHNSAHPGLLPGILDGIDTLKRIPGHRQNLVFSIDRAYTSIVKIYINLLGAPLTGAALSSSTTTTTTTTTIVAAAPAASAGGGGGCKAPPTPPSLSEEGAPLAKRQKTDSSDEDEDHDESQNETTSRFVDGDDSTKLATPSV